MEITDNHICSNKKWDMLLTWILVYSPYEYEVSFEQFFCLCSITLPQYVEITLKLSLSRSASSSEQCNSLRKAQDPDPSLWNVYKDQNAKLSVWAAKFAAQTAPNPDPVDHILCLLIASV